MTRKTNKRIYGNIKELKYNGSNCWGCGYSMMFFIKDKYGDFYPLYIDGMFNGYTRKQIFKLLKEKVILKYGL